MKLIKSSASQTDLQTLANSSTFKSIVPRPFSTDLPKAKGNLRKGSTSDVKIGIKPTGMSLKMEDTKINLASTMSLTSDVRDQTAQQRKLKHSSSQIIKTRAFPR